VLLYVLEAVVEGVAVCEVDDVCEEVPLFVALGVAVSVVEPDTVCEGLVVVVPVASGEPVDDGVPLTLAVVDCVVDCDAVWLVLEVGVGVWLAVPLLLGVPAAVKVMLGVSLGRAVRVPV
jgi:hypothetical protein